MDDKKLTHKQIHDLAVKYWASKFDTTPAKTQKYGDFCIELNNQLIGFEVYCKETPVTLLVKKAVCEAHDEKIELPSGRSAVITHSSISYSTEHIPEFLIQIFSNANKEKQFQNKYHKKILVVDLTDGDSTYKQILGFDDWYLDSSITLPVGCSGVAIVVRNIRPNPSYFILNKNATYALTEDEVNFIKNIMPIKIGIDLTPSQ